MADVPIIYPITVMAFVAATAVVGVLAVKFVKKSSKRYIVAGKSLPLFFIGTMLVSEAVDGNANVHFRPPSICVIRSIRSTTRWA